MCYVVLARHVLHEPNAAGSLYGDALGFLDWAVLWTLWYVLFLGSYGLPKHGSTRTHRSWKPRWSPRTRHRGPDSERRRVRTGPSGSAIHKIAV